MSNETKFEGCLDQVDVFIESQKRETIVLQYQQLAKWVAKEFYGCGIPQSDLKSMANIGILQGYDAYLNRRPDQKNLSLTTWLTRQARWEILNNLRDMRWLVRVPPHVQALRRKWRRAERFLSHSKGKRPSRMQTAIALGATEVELEMIQRSDSVLTIDQLEDVIDYRNDCADEPTIDVVDAEQFREWVSKVLLHRERIVIELRFGLGDGQVYSLREVGQILRVTRERIRQIELKAIRKLQEFYWRDYKTPLISGAVKIET